MRLIERMKMQSVPPKFEYRDGWIMWNKVNEIIDILNSLIKTPTIDPENLVEHGKWEYEHGAWQCSRCAEDNPYGIDFETRKFSNYCPNCGAKMDGGAESEL